MPALVQCHHHGEEEYYFNGAQGRVGGRRRKSPLAFPRHSWFFQVIFMIINPAFYYQRFYALEGSVGLNLYNQTKAMEHIVNYLNKLEQWPPMAPLSTFYLPSVETQCLALL